VTDKVTEFDGLTKHDIPAEKVLQASIDAKVDPVVIVGYAENGELYVAGSSGDAITTLGLLVAAQHYVVEVANEQEASE
jgi:hypothetical protein